ncbi:MAG TPA: Ig-like domain-containing protein [Anaerolineales bacterium]|nr:Ig-like domain-containing protein [Anaerolineales bacterium]
MRTRISSLRGKFVLLIPALAAALALGVAAVRADSSAQALPFSQDWSNTGLITTNDDWSGVPGIIGYRGDNLTSANDVDPQTVIADESTVDVNANQTSPNTFITGGVAEFHIADPAVALQGSGTADAPFLLLHLDTTGLSNITVAYNLRDIDGSSDNATQQVALQFRVGASGNFTNVPAGYVADATTGPSLATLVTPVSAVLPAAANNQALVQVRIITTNASGNDEWVGADDIYVSGSPGDAAPLVSSTAPANGAVDVAVAANITVGFSEPVDVTGSWFDISCTASNGHTATASGGPSSFILNPATDFFTGETCTATVFAALVTDQDTNDPPDNMEADFAWSFSTVAPPPPSPMIINEVDSDTPGTDALEFVELYDGGIGNTDLSGLVVVFYNGNGDVSYAAFDLDGFTTDSAGYFHLGNAAVSPAPDIVFGNNLLQNGADAVALYNGDASSFPNGTSVTTANLIDAVVYDTNDADDAGLLVLLNAGQPQVDEASGGNSESHSIQRCPNGAGGQRNTATYLQNTASPGATNNCGVVATIMQIQDAAHRSPLEGQLVRDVAGVVTGLRTNGFYMQDALGDGDLATSDGVFVFTSSVPTVAVGDSLLVRGNVVEFRPGGASSANLTTTEITGPFIQIVSSGNPLPASVILGAGGRLPPTSVIDDDATGDVETSGSFDATTDGIDFYESLEGMRVQVNDAVAVSRRADFGSNREIAVVGDSGASAGLLTPRGGIIIQAADFNPERIILNDLIVGGSLLPAVDVGDTFPGATVGVIDYNFGNFKLEVTMLPPVAFGGLPREMAAPVGVDQLSVATFNVENLDPNDPPSKFAELASLIVDNLGSPDIIAVEEVQDNNGPTNDTVVDATTTFNTLIAAIQSTGGPMYDFRQIDPVDDQDGGEPGGNIRVGFLFRTDRGLAFVDRPGGGSTTATTVVSGPDGPELSFSPGRIDPTNTAFNTSRKPLAGEFTYNGHRLFVIANHFNSKGGDDPLFGRFQPPVLSSEVQRNQQVQVVNDFVDAILAVDAAAKIVVLGDLNDFEFSTPLSTLKGGVLSDLIETLPQNERYSYVFEGNSQALDHTLVSANLFGRPFAYDVVHVNAEFAVQASDHDPQVALLTLHPPLTALGPANVWIGLKNSDAVGIKFDLLAEVYLDSDLVGSGQLDKVPGGSSGFNNARLNTIPINLFAPVDVPPGSVLSLKLYVRNTCFGNTHNSGTARLWYNDSAANSRFNATIEGVSSDYFLRDGFVLATTPGPGPKKTIDVAAGRPCSPFKPFGAWSGTP